MFKLDDSPQQDGHSENIRIRGPSEKKRKGQAIGIKLSTQTLEQNKPNLNNRRKIDVVSSSGKTLQNTDRGSAFKGIQVTSGRSSTDRRPLATSRSRQKQKQSRQIKSQTNTSQFQYEGEVRDPSIQDRSPSQQSHDDICRGFELKLRQAISKYQMSHRTEVTELTDIINSNEERLNNLIVSLNMLMEKNERKEKTIQKLEQRIASLTSYHEQCYAFTVERYKDLQTVFRVISEELQGGNISNEHLQMKEQNVDRLTKNIFLKQRARQKSYEQYANGQVDKLTEMLDNLAFQVNYLDELYGTGIKIKYRQRMLEQYLIYIKKSVNSTKRDENIASTNDTEPQCTSYKELNHVIQSLQEKVNSLQKHKVNLQQSYQEAQEKAKATIWELSNLLHKNERQLQTTQLYSRQIQNKLIESKLKESNLRTEMESFYKNLQASKDYEYNELQKQKDCFKERFENLFKHNQYLQEVNCKNKIDIMSFQKQLENMTQQIYCLKAQIVKKNKNIQQLQGIRQQLSTKIEDQRQLLSSQIQTLRKESQEHKFAINKNAKLILKLQMEIKQLLEEKKQFQDLHAAAFTDLSSIKRQFEQQKLYSEHLEQENEELSRSLNEYKKIFQNQSTMFKTTIDKLRQENTELHKNLELQSDKIFACQPKKYENKLKLIKPLSNDDLRVMNSYKSSKIQILKDLFQSQHLILPVLCQIDASGYLKYHEQGTFVYDKTQNLFELTQSEKQMLTELNIISFFQ